MEQCRILTSDLNMHRAAAKFVTRLLTPEQKEHIQRESKNVLGKLREQDFQHAFQQWQRRWDRCVAAQGDYFEGNAAQT
jgi:ATP-dependent helicase/DNAse subunit B